MLSEPADPRRAHDAPSQRRLQPGALANLAGGAVFGL